MKAYLMSRYEYPSNSITERWKMEDGKVLYVDYDGSANDTMVFPYDIESNSVEHWIPLLVRRKDMTGGKAMRELGYEPVEGGE